MSDARLRLVIDTPGAEHVLDDVVAVRLEGPGGHRGVLPGHERAVTAVLPGVVHASRGPGGADEVFVAVDGGMASIGPREVRVVVGWAEVGESLAQLVRVIERRARVRELTDARGHEGLERHEAALRRALARLEREAAR